MQAVRYRWVQGVVLALLTALVIGSAVFGPWYDRALQQAWVASQLSQAAVDVTGIRVQSQTPEQQEAQPVSPATLVRSVPQQLNPYFTPAVRSSTVQVATRPVRPGTRVGPLVWRSGMCRHIHLAAGSCPKAKNAIAISAHDAHNFGWHVGSNIPVAEIFSSFHPSDTPHRTLNVVGIYKPIAGDYWFGSDPAGASNAPHAMPGSSSGGGATTHDWWLSPWSTFTGVRAWKNQSGPGTSWMGVVNEADLRMDTDRVGIDELLRIAPVISKFAVNPAPTNFTPNFGHRIQPGALVTSGVGDLAERAAHARHQANTLVPLFMVQLALLATLALWLVLGAAAESRRPEVALARLRGNSRAAARRMLLRDIGVPLAAGVVVGIVAAGCAVWVATHVWLAAAIPFEVRSPVVITAVIAAAAPALLLWVKAHTTARTDPALLLRRVPPRHSGWRMRTGDLLLAALGAAFFVGSAAGSLTGTLGMVASTALALACGVVLAHVIQPAGGALGRLLLHRGRLAPALAMLHATRRPSTRQIVATITVATALLVFAADALVVGSRNRTARAQAETGAPAVSTIDSNDLGAVQAAVRRAAPHGDATTVVMVTPPGEQGSTTVAADPRAFARIAQFPGIDARRSVIHRLQPKKQPIQLRGSGLSVEASSIRLTQPVELRAVVIDSQARQRIISLGDLPGDGTTHRRLHTKLPCTGGCTLTGFDFSAPPTAEHLDGSVELAQLAVTGEAPKRISLTGHGCRDGSDSGDTSAHAENDGKRLRIDVQVTGADDATLVDKAVPDVFPAVTAGPLPAGSHGDRFTSPGLDGIEQHMKRVAALPYIPGAPPAGALVDLHSLQLLGAPTQTTALVQVWYARDDPTLISAVTEDLKRHGITVDSTTTTSAAVARYSRTAATWALQLGVVVGAAAALIAALVLVIAISTSWRSRAHDYASLRVTGVGRRSLLRAAVAEQIPLTVVAVLLGAVCGVVGASYAMPKLPLFDTAPKIPILDFSTDWPATGWATLGSIVVLAAVGWAMAGWVIRRSAPGRIREDR